MQFWTVLQKTKMPWRKNTLTAFEPAGMVESEEPESALSVASDRAASVAADGNSLESIGLFGSKFYDDRLVESLDDVIADAHFSACGSEGPIDADWELVGAETSQT